MRNCSRGPRAASAGAGAGTGAPPGRLNGFASSEETARVLTSPEIAYATHSGGKRLVALRVSHAPLAVQQATARTARFQVFEDLGLTEPGAAPHSVLLAAHTKFAVAPPMAASG